MATDMTVLHHSEAEADRLVSKSAPSRGFDRRWPNVRRHLHLFVSRRIPEIAAQLGRSEAAVAGLLFRGWRRLRREMPPC